MQLFVHWPGSETTPCGVPLPWRELELDLHISNQDIKTDGNKMPALIQKACGGKIKWEKRMNVFSVELCASSRARFVRSRLNQPDASWQKVGYDWNPGVGKIASIFLSTATRDQISTKSQAGSVSFDLLAMYTTMSAIVDAVKSLWQGLFRFEFCGSNTF